MKKGFIHIVEIVVISLVMFVLVIQLTSIPGVRSDWDRTKLLLMGNDVLFTLDAKGVNWLDKNEVESGLREVLNNTNLNFGLEVKNALKANITVGCIRCSSNELDELRSVLGSFTLNGERVSFIVTALETLPLWLDVAYLGKDALPDLENDIKDFLRAGKGVVEVRDLTSIDTGRAEIFGLETWGTAPDGSNVIFSVDESSKYWNIRKYFWHILNNPGWVSFDGFLAPSENVSVPAGDEERVVLKEYTTGAPALVVNELGSGRAVWLSGGNNSLEERRVLIKTLVAWAAGETYRVVPADIKDPQTFSLHTIINKSPNPMFQPVEIVLSLGYIF